MTDEELLITFIERRDPAAFEALTRIHGEMVLGVGLRVLGNLHDAEDAFQVTFLVLARKAASIVPRSMVGNWLYGVAYRTALKAKVTIARRQAREKHMPTLPEPAAQPDAIPQRWLCRLEEELERLPEHYRLPVLLCDLDGRTQKDAAQQLGWPEGTVSVRLMRARNLLAQRMRREGTAYSIAALGMALLKNAGPPSPPSELLIFSTVKAASQFAANQTTSSNWVSPQVLVLTKGVLNSMASNYLALKVTAASLAAMVGIGAAGFYFQMQASEPVNLAAAPQKPATKEQKQIVKENVKSVAGITTRTTVTVPESKTPAKITPEIELPEFKVSEKVRADLGPQIVDIIVGAQRVESYLLKKIEGEGTADFLDFGAFNRWAVAASAKERGPEFAAKIRAVVLDEATRHPTSPGILNGEVGFRLWKGKESVTLIVDFATSKFLIVQRDAQGRKIDRADFTETMGNFLRNAKGEFDDGELFARVKGLAVEAFPNDKSIAGVTDFAEMLDKAEQFEVLTLNPDPIGGNAALRDKKRPKAPDEFHGYRILGSSIVKDEIARKMLVAAFKEGVEKKDDTASMAAYAPRHGLRMTRNGKTADLVIAFENLIATGYVGDEVVKSYEITEESGKMFNSYLKTAKVPLTEKEKSLSLTDSQVKPAGKSAKRSQSDTRQKGPEQIRDDLGERTIGILSGAERVDVYRLKRTDLESKPDILGTNNEERWTITSKGKKGLPFAAKVRALLFDPATRKLPGMGITDGQVGYQLWKGKESVTVIFDFPSSGFLVLGRDAEGKLISGVQGQLLFDAKGKLDNGQLFTRAKALASEAFPNDKAVNGLTDFAAMLDKADQIELLSLDPASGGMGPQKPEKGKPADKFHRYKILGSTIVKDPATREKLVSSFKKSIEEAPEAAAGCFIPRHGLRVTRAGKTADYVICFQCLFAMVYVGDQPEKTYRISGDPAETFNKVLKKAKIPLPPQPKQEEE